LSANFRGRGGGGRPPTTVGVRKLRVPGLSRTWRCLRDATLAVLIQYRRVTDTQTHDDG